MARSHSFSLPGGGTSPSLLASALWTRRSPMYRPNVPSGPTLRERSHFSWYFFAIRVQSLGRPAELPQGDFRAAVAFYPASCNERVQGAWTSTIPLLVLVGAEDVWTPAASCKELLDGAAARARCRQPKRYV